MTAINWHSFGEAQDFYLAKGYQPIEVPWLVPASEVDITKPPHARNFETWAGCLVASGEQSLLAMRKSLKPGKYQCITPCFRDEPLHDDLHRQWFMKLELMRVLEEGEDGSPSVRGMLVRAMQCFQVLHPDCRPAVVKTGTGWDIEINGIEVGSYGLREHEGFRWAYGTGVAEPRLSQAVDLRNHPCKN